MRSPAVAINLPGVPFEHLLAMAPYTWPYDHWITQLKFAQRMQYARALTEQFVHVVRPLIPLKPQCIWPTPLHPKRLMQRQFNQAYQVAQSIGHALDIPVCEGPLRRIHHTQAQTELSAAKRRKNMREAFDVGEILDFDHVVLFDDVLTTGATLAAQYHALKAFKPQMRIDIWSLCISLPQQTLPACVNKT